MPNSHDMAVFDDEGNAINLQLEEIQIQRGFRKGKYLEGREPDRELAIQDFEIELGRLLLFLGDQRLAQSIEKAIDDDATVLAEANAEEDRARGDRAMALRISGEDLEAEDIEGLKGVIEGIENTRKLEGNLPLRSVKESDSEGFVGPSAPQIHGWNDAPRRLSPYMAGCVACGDVFHLSGLIRCPCGDLYCPECLKSLFVRATTDETLFPPRCCRQNIPLSVIETELSVESISNFHSATIEFSTTDRTYCARTDCGRFIPPAHVHSSRAICRDCRAETCAHCKRAFHIGDCPKDQALQALLALAEGERWRRCFGCNAMVELSTGCNHIT